MFPSDGSSICFTLKGSRKIAVMLSLTADGYDPVLATRVEQSLGGAFNF